MTTVGVCLVGHSLASSNLGVGALTLSNIHLVRCAAARVGVDVEFTLLLPARDDASTVRAPGIAETIVGAKDLIAGAIRPSRTLRALVDSTDLVVDIGAGDSYTDLYGGWRLAYLVAAKRVFGRHGVPIVMAPQTVGPFATTAGRHAGGFGLRACSTIFGRDEASCDLVGELAPSVPVELAADVAFCLPFTPQPPPRTDRIRVGLNVSGLLVRSDAGARFGLRMDMAEFARGFAAAVARRCDAQLVLVPHVMQGNPHEGGDLTAIDGIEEAEVAGPFGDASAAKSHISGLDVLVSARMHATVAAVSSGVPAIPIAYSKKVPDLYGALGYPYWIDARTEDVPQAIKRAMEWVDDLGRLGLAAEAANGVARTRLAAYEQCLTTSLEACL